MKIKRRENEFSDVTRVRYSLAHVGRDGDGKF